MIIDPITIQEDAKVRDALNLMHEYGIGGIPVVKKDKKLIGIVTNRDLRLEENEDRPVREIMTRDVITANVETNHIKAAGILQKHRIEKLPIVNDKGQLIGLMTYKDITMNKDRPNSCKDSNGRLRVAAGVGVTNDTMERASGLVNAGADAIVIDTAHGHSKGVLEMATRVKKAFPDVDLIIGNVGTAEGAKALAKAGADAVKVGIGPGSICTTRIIAGVGIPQLTAIFEVSQALIGTSIPVIADGGIRYSGDIVKALATGADSVMAGSLFAGVEESPGDTIIYNGRKFKSYRGMGSLEAMQQGSKDRYFQDVEDDLKKLVPEGIEGRVPYKGPLMNIVQQLLGGLRQSMGYVGCTDIAEMRTKPEFVRVTFAGMRESHVHDVTITKEAPNYRVEGST